MIYCKTRYRYFFMGGVLLFLLSCNGPVSKKEQKIVTDPAKMDNIIAESLDNELKFAIENDGKIDDSSKVDLLQILNKFYNKKDYEPVWSIKEKWRPLADTLFQFITNAETEGLFPNDYHFKNLSSLKNKLDTDSLSRMNANLWTKADLLLTDGFMHIIKDLKQGRLKPDSVSLNKDSVLDDQFFIASLNGLLENKQFASFIMSIQPRHIGYWELKKGIKPFLDSMDRKKYTYVSFPFKKSDIRDSLKFIKELQLRLFEGDCINFNDTIPDSVQLQRAIKKYQVKKGLLADGAYGKTLIASLNNTDLEKFKRIAITLDKYKQLPEKMPEKYIWVNLPGYYLNLIDKDTVVFESKVICGKPETRTPLLTGRISDMITYPTWTVPNSIIVKQYLPKLKDNPNYISKIGLKLMNNKGEDIDPNTVNWSKYSKGIPYKIMQASGDNNSLGVIKFNFNNPYAVYLHDTNQRYLFKRASRALSHGCVRVEEWEKLADFIAGNDSALSLKKDSLRYTADSIKTWIAKKERHRVDVKNQIPLFIRYFSCEGRNGRVKFFDDIYGEDKMLMQKYFAKK